MPFWLGAAIVVVYGAVVGSFLNVLIHRLPNDQSIVRPPSHCPKCKTKLKLWDLVPLFSFLAMGRRCRYCGEPISWRYFTVELLTAAVFLALHWRYQFEVDFFAFALLAGALIAVLFIDLEHWIIPDEISIFVVALGVGRDIVSVSIGERALMELYIPFTAVKFPMLASIPSLIACGAVFYLIAVASEWVFKKEAMGGGDIKLAAGIGANLLFVPAMVSFFVAIFLGAVIGVALLASKSRSRKDALPFGPMMVAGVFAVVLAYPLLVSAWIAWQNWVTGWIVG